MQAVMDGYLCLLFLTTGVVIENVFIPFATAAFFTFVLVSIFGMRYLLVVWRIQRPESVRPSTPASPAPEQRGDEDRTPDTENLLPVANVRRPNTNEESNPQRDITHLYYRLCKEYNCDYKYVLYTNFVSRCCPATWLVLVLSICYKISPCSKYHCRFTWIFVLFILGSPDY